MDQLKSWHHDIFGMFAVFYVLELGFDVGVGSRLLYFFLEIRIPGLHRMILQSYSWIAGSKNTTTSKNEMNATKKEKDISKMQFKDWALHGPVPHNFRDHFCFHSALFVGTAGEISQSWKPHDLLRTELSFWTRTDAHWGSKKESLKFSHVL